MRAELRIELRTTAGELIEVRQAHNAVMKAGAQLIADLFAGKGNPITHMGVGTSDTPESDSFSTANLTNEVVGDQPALTGDTDVALTPDAFFAPEIDESRRLVRVRVRGTLPPAAAIGTVREAGLLSKKDATVVLYNRVTFAPINKGNDHELTLFWDVTFPYGDLQWWP